MPRESSVLRSVGSGVGLVALVTASAFATSWCVGTAVQSVAHERTAPWILGRAAGITSYLLLVALVLLGLVLSHPHRAQWRRPSPATRIRTHVSLAVFTLVFTVLHVVVLATDRYAGVGWQGALLPLGSSYRPLPVTLGVLALWSGLAAGVTAALAGRLPRRAWWPVHKVAIVALLLVWVHGVLAGIDTPLLLSMYVVTGGGVLAVAATRYAASSHRDEAEELAAARASVVATSLAPRRITPVLSAIPVLPETPVQPGPSVPPEEGWIGPVPVVLPAARPDRSLG